MSDLDNLLAQAQAQQAQQRQAQLTPPAVRPFQQPQGTPSVQPAPAAPPTLGSRVSGLLGSAAKFVSAATSDDSLKAIGAGLLRVPGQVVGGAIDSLADAGKFVDHNIDPTFVRSTPLALVSQAGQVEQVAQHLGQKLFKQPGASLADILSDRKDTGQIGNPAVNQFVTQGGAIASALVGNEGGAIPEAATAGQRILAGAGKLLLNSAKVGAATAAFTDPRAGRISDLIQSAGIHNAVIDYLASNPDDSDLEARFKTGLEGAGVNAALEPVISPLVKLIKASMGGDAQAAAEAASQVPTKDLPPTTTVSEATPEEAAADHLDRAFASGRTTEARYQAADATLQGEQAQAAGKPVEAPEGTPDDTPPVADGTRHTDVNAPAADDRTTIAADANAALAKAGVKGEDQAPDTMQLTPDGKVVVSAAAKDAADQAGVGRAFHSVAEEAAPDPVLFKEEDADGGKRVVGAMPSKDDLQGFVNEAQHYIDHPDEPVDITHANAPETAAKVGQWSLGKLGASYDVPAFGRALADRLQSTGRPRTDEELNTLAQSVLNQTGLHPDDALPLAAQFAGDTKDIDVGMQVVRTLQSRVLSNLMDLRGLPWDSLTDDSPEIDAGHLAVHNAMTLSQAVAEAKGNIGAGLRVMQLPDADAYMEGVSANRRARMGGNGGPPMDQEADPQQVPLPRNKEELKAWLDQLDAISTTGDPEAVQAFLRGKLTTPGKWAYLGTSFPNFFTGALVSAPRTLIRDLWGPALISGFNTAGRMGAGAMQAINPALDAGARQEAWVASWGAARAYATTISDVADVLRSAAKTTASGFTTAGATVDPYWDPFGSNMGSTHTRLGGGNPIDMNAQGVPRTLINAAMGRDGAGVTGAVPYYLGNAINKFPQAVMALHGGFNEFAQSLSYLGEVRASAYQEASKLGLQGQDFKDFLQQRLTTARDPASGAATDPNAFAQAQRTTLVRTPSPEANDPIAMRMAFQGRQALVQNMPWTRFILPIFTVPANALGESIRRIPGLGFLMKQSGEELTGQHGVAAMVDAYGRQMTGAAALMGGAMLAHSGALTGAGPTNPVDKAVWEGKNPDGSVLHQPYSIRVNGKWYSYAKSDVVGPMLSIVSAFYDKTMYQGDDLSNHALAAVGGLAEYFKDQASLQGLAQVMNFGGNPAESDAFFTRLLGQTSSGFVPGFIHQLRDQIDPEQRVHRTVGDYVMDAIPSLSQKLDPVRNVLGEPVMKPQSGVFGTLPVSTANLSTFASDPVQDELYRLYDKTGEAHGVLPASLGANSHTDMRDVKLEDGSSLYDALMRYRMVSKNDEGQNLRQALQQLHASQDYIGASNGTSDEDGSKGQMNRQLFTQFTQQSKQDVAAASPTAASYLALAKAMTQHTDTTNGMTAHDLAKTPSILPALGINIQDYEDTVKGQ